MGVMCSTSQCELRSTFPNLRVTNVIRIVTFYTLPPLESPTSSWMTRSQRSRRRDKLLEAGSTNKLCPIPVQFKYNYLMHNYMLNNLNCKHGAHGLKLLDVYMCVPARVYIPCKWLLECMYNFMQLIIMLESANH